MRGRVARFTAAFQALLLMATLVLPALAAATEITTDLWIYQDGDTVTVTGIDFGADEVVDFVTTDAEGVVVDSGSAPSDENGGVVYDFVLNVTTAGIYNVVGTGQTSGLTAATQFDPPPGTPTNLRIVDSRATGGGITLTWAASTSPGADCYRIFRNGSAMTAKASSSSQNLCGASVTNYVDNVLSPAVTYADSPGVGTFYYYVTGVKTGSGGGESASSNQVSTASLNSSASSATFGATATGSSSAPQGFTVTNNYVPAPAGAFSVVFRGITITGANAADFSVTPSIATGTSVPNTGANSYTFSVTFSPQPGPNGSRNATLFINASDPAHTPATIFNSRTFALSGTATDGTAPAGSISINSGAASTNSASVTLNLAATDGVGVTAYRIANGSDCSAAVDQSITSTTSYSANVAFGLSAGDGTKTVCVQYRDAAGNQSSTYTDTINLDSIAPAGSTNINSGATSTSTTSVTLNLAATDAQGVTAYRIANGSDCSAAVYQSIASTTSYSANVAFSLSSGDGTKTVCVQYRDALTNESATFTDTIILDTTGPSVTLNSLTGSAGTDSVGPFGVITNDGASLAWTSGESGTYEIRRNNCSSTLILSGSMSAGSVTTNFAASQLLAGANNYVICAFDALGNDAPASAQFSINEDHSTVTVLIRSAGLNPSNFGASVTFQATVSNLGGNPNGVGTVTFFDGASAIASCSAVSLSGIPGNTASCTISTLALGVHSLTAVYSGGSSGDNSWTGSTSLALSHTVANLDNTKPVITATATKSNATAYVAGTWTNLSVMVAFSCTDDSGSLSVNSVASDGGTVSSDTSTGSFTAPGANCVDAAGNVADPVTFAPIKIDKTAPGITGDASPDANVNGWNNTDVTVSYVCSDALSGVWDLAADDDDVLTAEGSGQSASGTCSDNAGNTTSTTVSGIKIDKTAPTAPVYVGGPASGASYYYGFVPVAPTCTSSDVLSGLTAAGCTVSGYSTALGLHTMDASATDKADNTSTTPRSYSVLAWTLTGFYSPVDMGGYVNTVKAGSTVPLKFEIFAGPTELTSTSYIKGFQATETSCLALTFLTADDIEITSTGGTTLRYDSTGGQFIQNWATPKNKAGSCFVVTMTTQDGTSLNAFFKLK